MKRRRNPIFIPALVYWGVLGAATALTAVTGYFWAKREIEQIEADQAEKKQALDRLVRKTGAMTTLIALTFGLGTLALRRGFTPARHGRPAIARRTW